MTNIDWSKVNKEKAEFLYSLSEKALNSTL